MGEHSLHSKMLPQLLRKAQVEHQHCESGDTRNFTTLLRHCSPGPGEIALKYQVGGAVDPDTESVGFQRDDHR